MSDNLKSYIITFKDSCPDDDYSKAKRDIEDQGGKITNEYELFKGFSASFPDGHVGTLSSHPHVHNVEEDKEVSIQ